MENPFALSEHIRSKAAEWVKDKTLNPSGCKIEVHSAYPSDKFGCGFDVSFDISYSYSIWIQALLTPFYILFGLFGIYEGIEYLEDIAYFKRFTPRGIMKKREAMAQTKVRFLAMMIEECKRYNKDKESNNG